MEITFPGNLKVDVHHKGNVIHTDQPKAAGGDSTAPAPYTLFLASIAACAGLYVLQFCKQREIPTDDIKLTMDYDRIEGRLNNVSINIHLPENFPDQYREAVKRSAQLCAVTKTIQNPPEFEVYVEGG